MKTIMLNKDLSTTIDDSDLNLVLGYKWHAVKGKYKYIFYAQAHIKRGGRPSTILLHRLILGLPMFSPMVDHIDGDGLNNQRHNLRFSTDSQNKCNAGKRRTHLGDATSSIYKGVSWDRSTLKWRVQITIQKKRIDLGCFEDEILAAKSYDLAAIKMFGEFARINFRQGKCAEVFDLGPEERLIIERYGDGQVRLKSETDNR